MIIGYPGSSKSTLAKKLAQMTQIPVCHIDSLRFLPDWQPKKSEDIKQEVEQS